MTLPESDLDLWSDQAILDPYPRYRELRDTGPAPVGLGADLVGSLFRWRPGAGRWRGRGVTAAER